MNTKIIPAAKITLATIALLAFCPTLPARTVPATPTAAAALVTLRYKFAVGQTRRFQYDMCQTVKSIRPADGAATLLTEDTEGNCREPHGKLIPIKSPLEMQVHQTTAALRDTDGAGSFASIPPCLKSARRLRAWSEAAG